MRIWDLPPSKLCRKHLLGEHRELHALWMIITQNKKGYSNHPETVRWKGKLKALYKRHNALVKEMTKRSYKHNSPLDGKLATGLDVQEVFVHTVKQQEVILKNKKCNCALF